MMERIEREQRALAISNVLKGTLSSYPPLVRTVTLTHAASQGLFETPLGLVPAYIRTRDESSA